MQVQQETNNWQSSWWLNQLIWKICSSKWIIFPIFGVKVKNIWNHHLAIISWVPPHIPIVTISMSCLVWESNLHLPLIIDNFDNFEGMGWRDFPIFVEWKPVILLELWSSIFSFVEFCDKKSHRARLVSPFFFVEKKVVEMILTASTNQKASAFIFSKMRMSQNHGMASPNLMNMATHPRPNHGQLHQKQTITPLAILLVTFMGWLSDPFNG